MKIIIIVICLPDCSIVNVIQIQARKDNEVIHKISTMQYILSLFINMMRFCYNSHSTLPSYFQDEERELLQPDLNSKDVRVINDLIEDLTRLETREKIPLARLNNNNNRDRASRAQVLTKQTSLVSGSSRGSGPESVIIETLNDKVSQLRSQWATLIRPDSSRDPKKGTFYLP